MPQLHTSRTSTLADRVVTLLEAKIGDISFSDPAIAGVSYGDQEKIPLVPWICVEPANKTRSWPPTPSDVTEIVHEILIYIYHANLTDGVEQSRREVDRLGEAVEELFNISHRHLRDVNGNDMVIYGYVVNNEAGLAARGNTRFRAARLTWRGLCKLRLTLAQ